MKFREVLSRVTGLSVPVFGVQWNPAEAECTAARRVLVFLEDRRVLYVPSEMEVPHHCVESVLRIREFLTGELGKLDEQQELAQSLRAMRAACRKFLSTVQADDRRIIEFGAHQGHYASWVFNGALGELRGVVGVHVASLDFQCAVQRRCFPAGANPVRQLSLQPVAIGAIVEVTKRLKPSV